MSNLFFRNPRLLALTIILVLVSGLSALKVLPRAEDPELVSRTALVFTPFPGAEAERVESLVTEPLEDELEELEEIDVLTSTSRAGISTLQIELRDDIDDVDTVWSKVRDRLADVERELPAGASAPELEEFTITAYTLIAGLTWDQPGEPNRAVLRRLALDLADRLRALPGTEDADLFGEAAEEVLVDVDPGRLAAHGLTVSDLSRAIRRGDSKVSAGEVRGARVELQVEVRGELDSLARIEDLPVRQGEGGRFLRLGDLADVRKVWREPEASVAVLGGRPGIAVAARMLPDRRVDEWARAARAKLEAFGEELPHGVGVSTLFDQSHYTQERLSGLFANLASGALLVMLVIFFTMGWRSALLVSSALPLTTLMVFEGMNLFGVPMNQMSLTGVIIALGLLIDNAIVMVDEVRHRLESERDTASAVSAAVKTLAVPLLGSTVTTVLAFMPIVLMPGGAGEFVGSMAVSVILALVSSLFLALTVVPALAGLLDRFAGEQRGSGLASRGLYSPRLARAYTRSVRALVARPLLGIAVALAIPVLGFVKGRELDEQFFPPADRDQFQLELTLPRHTALEETRRIAVEARELMLENEAVSDVHWFVGESAPKFYYNLLEGQRNASYYAQALVQLTSREGSIAAIRELQQLLDDAFPQARFVARQIEQGPPFGAPVELRVFGPSLAVLRELGEDLRAELAALPEVIHTHATLVGGHAKLFVELDEEKARLAGLDNTAVAEQLAASLEGTTGGSLVEATEELPVRVRVGSSARGDLDRVATMELLGGQGWTPLSALGALSIEPETAAVPHRDGRRVNVVEGFLTAGTLPGTVVKELEEMLAAREFSLPDGYSWEYGGEAAERDEAVGKLAATAGVLLVLMGASLVLAFDSFVMAAIIGLVGFFSVGLSLLSLWIFGYPFGFMSIVGTMGLVGVAINDSIVVLAGLRADERACEGDVDAIVAVTGRATRHVLSTSLTTMAGFVPLMLAGGAFWPPVAVAIGGGVAGSTLIALTFVPATFRLLARPRRTAPAALGRLVPLPS